MGVFTLIGRACLAFLRYVGELGLLFGQVCESFRHGKIRGYLVLQQIVEIGYRSQTVVIVTGAFTGAVLAAQSLFQFSLIGMETGAGALVSVAMLRELGPSITALMLAGRIGAGMAAEIGTMKVTEQIDALRAIGVHPIDFLVTPRVIAMFIAMPLLIAESAAFGILSSLLVGAGPFGVNPAYWMNQVYLHTDATDIAIALIKGLVFGFIIVITSCHQGLSVTNGAVGVGQGTTRAMVYSALALLVFNFFLTLALNLVFPLSGIG